MFSGWERSWLVMAKIQEQGLFTQANRAISTHTLRKSREFEIQFLPYQPQKTKIFWSKGFLSLIHIGINHFFILSGISSFHIVPNNNKQVVQGSASFSQQVRGTCCEQGIIWGMKYREKRHDNTNNTYLF